MATVVQLAAYLLGCEPEKDVARLSYYHYLKNLRDSGEAITSGVSDDFLRRALYFSPWAEQKAYLVRTVTESLQMFSEATAQAVELPSLRTSEEIQVIDVESMRNLTRVVERHFSSQLGPHDRLRLIPDRDQRLIAILLYGNGELAVRLYPRKLLLRDGEIEPLSHDVGVSYLPRLQFNPNQPCMLDLASFTFARFFFRDRGIRGVAVRGYTFQKQAVYDGQPIESYPALFYALKRLESFYIDRATDPLYRELTIALEQAAEIVSRGGSEAVRFAQAALERGRLTYEWVYPEDRVLRLLLENLARAIQLVSEPQSAVSSDPTPRKEANGVRSVPTRLTEPVVVEESLGPDLLELQESEPCEKLSPVNRMNPPA